MYERTDTIAAIATARGNAALGILRISGPGAAAVLEAIVPGARAEARPRRVIARTALHPGSGEPIDEVLCFYCDGPGTATGEDTAEIQGHGGTAVMGQLLDAALAAGAKAAEPGEFTFRAYRNGRIDLTQAEAVMGLIGARSDRAARLALCQLEGILGRSLEREFEALTAASAEVEAGLDFPDEELPLASLDDLALRLASVSVKLEKLAASFALGSKLADGARVAIVGPPNAGKSSLLNRLVGEDRALVDPEPGTTRDVIEGRAEARGIPLVFLDTAGLRKDPDRVEGRGIEKAIETARKADLLIFVLDGTVAGRSFYEQLSTLRAEATGKLIIAVNKRDLPAWRAPGDGESAAGNAPVIPISALTGQGIDRLLGEVAALLGDTEDGDSLILTTARQHAAVSGCLGHVQQAIAALRGRADLELVAADLRWAREKLASLWGLSAEKALLDAVFSTFCLGK